MRMASKTALIAASAASALSLLGAGIASATPPHPVPEPHGGIRMDLAPGEWWECDGYSSQPPFYEIAPGALQFTQGPRPIHMHWTPGADVWVRCTGTGAPFIYYGPIVKAGS